MVPMDYSPDEAKRDKEVIDTVYEHGQEHIFRFWNELADEQKNKLLEQLSSVDFKIMNTLIQDHIFNPTDMDDSGNSLEPVSVIDVPSTFEEKEQEKRAKEIGLNCLRNGEVGVFIVAGGQGSRLGYNGPKGCFSISPVKNKPIFQLHSEQIVALEKKYGITLPFYIMTSEENHTTTKKFFETNDYFGLREVHFFKQNMIPAVDSKGKFLLSEKDSLFMNPNGHGGSIFAIKNSGALENMKSKGIKHIFYFQVDNILAKIADPVFIGHHVIAEAQMSNKAVSKTHPDEKVGVFGKIDGKPGIIEYNVLPDNLKTLRDEQGNLKFSAGNIAIHMINVDFLERLSREEMSLPFYKAFKAIPYVSHDGVFVKPDSPNAYKFEMFVFDALKKTSNSVTMMVDRSKEFAPVKNKSGDDSPDTAKKMASSYFRSWLRKAGFNVSDSATVEVSPLFATSEKEFLEKIKHKDINLSENIYIE